MVGPPGRQWSIYAGTRLAYAPGPHGASRSGRRGSHHSRRRAPPLISQPYYLSAAQCFPVWVALRRNGFLPRLHGDSPGVPSRSWVSELWSWDWGDTPVAAGLLLGLPELPDDSPVANSDCNHHAKAVFPGLVGSIPTNPAPSPTTSHRSHSPSSSAIPPVTHPAVQLPVPSFDATLSPSSGVSAPRSVTSSVLDPDTSPAPRTGAFPLPCQAADPASSPVVSPRLRDMQPIANAVLDPGQGEKPELQQSSTPGLQLPPVLAPQHRHSLWSRASSLLSRPHSGLPRQHRGSPLSWLHGGLLSWSLHHPALLPHCCPALWSLHCPATPRRSSLLQQCRSLRSRPLGGLLQQHPPQPLVMGLQSAATVPQPSPAPEQQQSSVAAP